MSPLCVNIDGQLGLRLEGVIEPDNEGMLRVREHISLSLRIFNQVLAENLLLVQDLHSEVLASALWLGRSSLIAELLD